jgi:kinetochore protein Mis13/DSN1
MSMVILRTPLESIGMNGVSGHQTKRRSARLSAEGAEENEVSVKKSKTGGSQTTTVTTKETDGDSNAVAKKKRKVYDQDADGFAFSKSKRSKPSKTPAVRNSNSTSDQASPAKETAPISKPVPAPAEQVEPKTAQKKTRKRLPTTPERDAATKTVRRSKRLSNENDPVNESSPHKPAHARSHARQERSPSPFQARPVTVEKKRRKGAEGVEEEKIMRIQLPFADTPVIKRNKEMRKASAEGNSRRSSSGMRGRRASSLIDEGRGNGESIRPLLYLSGVVAVCYSAWRANSA